MILKINETLDSLEVRQILMSHLQLSHRMISRLKALPDGILLNSHRVTVRARVHTGDILSLAVEDDSPSQKIQPVDIPLEVIYEDEDIILVNKPAFMPTIPSHDHYEDTLANALLYRYRGTPFVFRPINRLDRNTSGIVLVAKNRISASRLSNDMKDRKIKKTYIALLAGNICSGSSALAFFDGTRGRIDSPIRRQNKSIILRECCSESDEGAASALTDFEILKSENGYTKVKVNTLTGRTHQIRVHFAHIGAPLLADDLYGKECDIISRHALHASNIELLHPTTREVMHFYAEPPDDLKIAEQIIFKTEQTQGVQTPNEQKAL